MTLTILPGYLIQAVERCAHLPRVTLSNVRSQLPVRAGDRIVGRALQRARKAGAIKFDSKRGWTVVEKKS